MKGEGLFDRRPEDRQEGGDNREEMACAEDLDFQEQGPGEGRTGLQWCRMGVRGVGDEAEEEGWGVTRGGSHSALPKFWPSVRLTRQTRPGCQFTL